MPEMGAADLLFAVFAFASGVAATAGFGVIALTPTEFRYARWAFISAGILLCAAVFVWGITTEVKLLPRVVITCIIGAVAFSCTVESVRWVSKRELILAEPDPREVVLQKNSDLQQRAFDLSKEIRAWASDWARANGNQRIDNMKDGRIPTTQEEQHKVWQEKMKQMQNISDAAKYSFYSIFGQLSMKTYTEIMVRLQDEGISAADIEQRQSALSKYGTPLRRFSAAEKYFRDGLRVVDSYNAIDVADYLDFVATQLPTKDHPVAVLPSPTPPEPPEKK